MAVRREAVRLELEDNFSRQMLQAAAATNALKSSLNDLDGTSVGTSRAIARTTQDTDRLSTSATRGSAAIDKYSGRLGILLKVAGTLGPALVPIGAVGVAGVAALSAQLGFAAVGMTSIIVAAQGVGAALDAVNKAHLDPTVENLRAAREALEGLDPAAQAFVGRFQEFRPVLNEIRNSAAAGFFPGLTESLDDFERIAPKIGDIMQAVGAVGGNLIAEGAEALAGPEWSEFMDFIAREAPPALDAMGRSIGNVAQGAAHLWQAFDPLSDGMTNWLLEGSRGFERWAQGLSETEGFQEFVRYVQENGPKVADATVAIANAVLQIAEAAAPLGGPVLDGITAFANAVATIADSPLGTPIMAAVTAMSALSLAAKAATISITATTAAATRLGVVSKASAPVAGGGAAGLTGAGNIAAVAAVVGGVAAYNLSDNFVKVLTGERSIGEATDAVQKWSNPVSAALGVIGIDILPKISEESKTTGKTFQQLAREWTHFDDLVGMMPEKVAGLGASYDEAAAGGAGFTRAVIQQARAMKRAEATIQGMNTALRAEKQAARAAADGFVDFGAQADDAKFSLNGWLRNLEKGAEAMRDFRINAQRAAERGLAQGLIRRLREMGPEGAKQLKSLANASEEQIARANRAWRSFSRETRLAGNEVNLTRQKLAGLGATKARPKIELLGADKAQSESDVARQKLAALGGMNPSPSINVTSNAGSVASSTAAALNAIADEQVYINVMRRNLGALGGADGMTVPGGRNPYGDKVYAHLAPGEEVISNRYGQADRNRALLKAINANRYANGGTIRSERPAGSAQRLNINVTAGDLRGSISTPAGQVDLTAVIRAEAKDVYDQERRFEGTQRG